MDILNTNNKEDTKEDNAQDGMDGVGDDPVAPGKEIKTYRDDMPSIWNFLIFFPMIFDGLS